MNRNRGILWLACLLASIPATAENFADRCDPGIIDPDPVPCAEWGGGPGGGLGGGTYGGGGGSSVTVPNGGGGTMCTGNGMRTAEGISIVLVRDGVNPMVTNYQVGNRVLTVYPSGNREPGRMEIGATGEPMTIGQGATVAPASFDWRCSLGCDSSGSYAGRIELDPAGMFSSNGLSAASFRILGDEANGVDRVSASGVVQVAARECFVQLTDVNASNVVAEVYEPSALLDDLDAGTGLYVTAPGSEPFAVYCFSAHGGGSDAQYVEVSETRGGESLPLVVYGFETMADGSVSVSVATGGEKTRERILLPGEGNAGRIVRERLRAGTSVAREIDVHYLVTNGLWRIAMKVEDPSGAALTNRFTYSQESGFLTGSTTSSGLVKEIEYDGSGRKTLMREHVEGGALPAKTVIYSYGPLGVRPHDPTGQGGSGILDDDGTIDRTTPRVETVSIGETVVSRTLRFVALDTSGHRIVEEVRLADAASDDFSAAWDDPANRRKFTDYMPENRCRPCSKRFSLVCHADGRIDRYEYASGTYSPGEGGTAGTFAKVVGGEWFRTIATHYPAGSLRASGDDGGFLFEPVPFRTTRDVVVEVRSSQAVVLKESYVFSGAEGDGYERIGWTATTRDSLGRETLMVKSDGSRTEKTYSGGRLSRSVDADGMATDRFYDGAGRLVRTVLCCHGVREDVTTDIAYSAADDVLARTVSAGGLCEVESNAYDRAGRHVWQLSKDGIETAWSYGTDAAQGLSLTTSIRAPGTSAAVTNAVLAYADGRILESRIGGAVKTAYEYGPLWSAVYLGPDGTASPRWTRTERNALGDAVCETKAGFGGSTLVASNGYDVAGNLVSVRRMEEGGATLSGEMYGYDAFGDNVLSVLDIDLDGAIGWTSDRIISNDTAYVKQDGDWWRESRTWSAQRDGSAALTLMRTYRTRLTGLGGADWLASETVETDEFGGETVSRTYRDHAAHTVTRVTDKPDSDVDALSVTVCGLEITNRTATGVTTVAEYDALGRPVASTDGRGIRSRVEYDGFGRVAAILDGAGGVTGYGYDALGRRTAETDPNGLVTATFYDAEGRVTSKRGATYPVDWTYDAYGEKATMTTYRSENLANGDVTAWLRDEATGLVTNKVHADGKGPSYAYTPDGRMSARTWARGVVTSYAYDGAGDRISTAYSDGTPSVACTYDRNGNILSAVTEGVSTSLYSYAESGLLTNEWQNGASIARTYDALGRPTGYILSTTAVVQSVSCSYDAVGRLASVTSGTNTFTYSYLYGTDFVSGYTCGDFVREVSYEPYRDLISAVTNRFGNRVISSFAYVNDAAGRRTAIRKGGEAMGSLAGAVDSYGYNGRNEVISARRVLANSTVQGFSEDFAYDPIGNRISATDYDETGAAHVSQYTANALNQYVSRTVSGWAAVRGMAHSDAHVTVNGNDAFRRGEYYLGSDQFDNSEQAGFAELETVAVLNGENGDLVSTETNAVFIAAATDPYLYDDDGNQRRVSTTTGSWQITYNGENRPVEWTDGDRVLLMAYDHQGRRRMYAEIRNGATNVLHRFTYDDYLCIARNREIDYSYGGGAEGFLWDPTEPVATRPLMCNPSTAPPMLYCHDGNKNVSDMVTVDGTVAAHYEYSSFGKVVMAASELQLNGYPAHVLNPYRFSSEYHDDALGLVYYNYRHYNPVGGLWLGRDAIEEDGGLYLYGFVGNSPSLKFDNEGNLPLLINSRTVNHLMNLFSGKCFETIMNWKPGGKNDSNADDKYKHCKASCEIANDCGADISALIGLAKEISDDVGLAIETLINVIPDKYISPDIKGKIRNHFMSSDFKDSIQDLVADAGGIACSLSGKSCEECCGSCPNQNK